MNDNYFTLLSSSTIQMMSANSGFLLSRGASLYLLFVTLALMYVGLSLAYPRHFAPVHFGHLLLTFLTTGLMLGLYNVPIPGLGVSLHGVLPQYAKEISEQIEGGVNQAVQMELNTAYLQLEAPGSFWSGFGGVSYWFIATILIAMMQFSLVAVISVGYVGVSLSALTGPLFIPWRIFPATSFLFRGWLLSFIGFAYYMIAASAVVYIFGTFLIMFFRANPGPYTLGNLAVIFMTLVAALLGSMFAMILVPSLAASQIAGRSGESGFRI
jgi:hypothetical protein